MYDLVFSPSDKYEVVIKIVMAKAAKTSIIHNELEVKMLHQRLGPNNTDSRCDTEEDRFVYVP